MLTSQRQIFRVVVVGAALALVVAWAFIPPPFIDALNALFFLAVGVTVLVAGVRIVRSRADLRLSQTAPWRIAVGFLLLALFVRAIAQV